jgi:hypothetical protein
MVLVVAKVVLVEIQVSLVQVYHFYQMAVEVEVVIVELLDLAVVLVVEEVVAKVFQVALVDQQPVVVN